MRFMMLMQMMLGLLVLHTMNLVAFMSLPMKGGFVAVDDTTVRVILIQRMMSMKMMLLLLALHKLDTLVSMSLLMMLLVMVMRLMGTSESVTPELWQERRETCHGDQAVELSLGSHSVRGNG